MSDITKRLRAVVRAPLGDAVWIRREDQTIFDEAADEIDRLRAEVESLRAGAGVPVALQAEPLRGWRLNHVRRHPDEDGVAEIGYLDHEDDRFAPIVTVDTGLYYQPGQAVPLAVAILGAIAAPPQEARAVPDGWRLVPVEPTPEMRDALRTGSRSDVPSDELCNVRYVALLAAASSPAEQQGAVAAERMRRALHDIAEEWAGAECGEPVHVQEAYAIGLAKRMYELAAQALRPNYRSNRPARGPLE